VENDALYSRLDNAPDTDAVWVRIPPTTTDYMPIVRYGEDKKADQDEYEIAVGAQDEGSTYQGKIVFRYTTNDEAEETICASGDRYDTGTWIHVVGVRESDNDCVLYINGTLVTGPTSGSSSGAIFVKKIGVGSNFGDDGVDLFNLKADVASWIHWNSDALTQTEVTELFNTNYGKNATRIHVMANRTNSAGVTQEVLIDHTDFELPFHDPAVNSPNGEFFFWSFPNSDPDSYKKSSQYNYTALESQLQY